MSVKKPYSVGYFSSYDRGLECLLDMWPKIKEKVPEATLDVAYGWNTFDYAHSNNPTMMQWKFKMIQKLRQDGVIEHGRLSHTELAKLMKTIQVWAYPTEFTEIHCITALKAQEAGCIPVTTSVAALKETVANGYKLDVEDIYTNQQAQERFIELIVQAFNPEGIAIGAVPNRYWPDVAKVWSEALA